MGDCEQTMTGHTSMVYSAAFSPDGLKIVSASRDYTVRVWSAATGDCEQTLRGHTSYVYSAAFSPEGRQIVSASQDKTVRVWDAQTGDCMQTMAGHTDPVNSAEFSFDGRLIVTASGDTIFSGSSNDNTVRVWDVATGVCQQTMLGHTSPVTSARFGPEGQKIVSASDDSTVRVWDAAEFGS